MAGQAKRSSTSRRPARANAGQVVITEDLRNGSGEGVLPRS
jgi:hypothetical protein